MRLQARVASSGHLSPMTTLRLVGGLPLIVGGSLATADACCCTGACCGCQQGGGFDCALTDESLALIASTLTDLGYINVSAFNQPGGVLQWDSQCCDVATEGCTTITVYCADGINQTDLTFCPCNSTAGACVDGVSAGDCAGGTFHQGASCADNPCGCPAGCPDLDGCNLVIVVDYGETQVEYHNAPAFESAINGYLNCTLDHYISDLPSENGGDIAVFVTVVYSTDGNCTPVPVANVEFGNPELAEFLPNVIVTIECNPLP